MDSKVVIITGASGGIGKEIVLSLFEAGYHIVVIDINQYEIDNMISAYNSSKIMGFNCDITNEAKIINIFAQIYDKYKRIDGLVNNAGMQYVSNIELFPTSRFRQMIDLMLTAPFIATKHVLPHMKEKMFGRIINMASINGLVGFSGKSAYNSAKHGLIGLTRASALETATFGITVNAVCPGYVDTDLVRNQLSEIAEVRGISTEEVLSEVIYPLVPQKRLLNPKEIAHVVQFLLEESSGGITGQTIVIDGGYTAQ